jgi:hypothetical protein
MWGVRPSVKGITKSKSMLSYCLMQPLLLVMPLTSGHTLHTKICLFTCYWQFK